MFNLDKWAGLVRTEYVLDGSTVDAAVLASMATVTGTGAVSVATPFTTPGGQLRLAVGATAGKATIILPPQLGNGAGGTLAAVAVEIAGISYTNLRPTLKAELIQQGSGDPKRYGIRNDEMGAHLIAYPGGAGVETVKTVMAGNLVDQKDAACGMLYDFGAQSMQAHFGYSPASNAFSMGGTWKLAISNETKASPAYYSHTLGIRQIRFTCIWGVPGGSIQRVY